MAGPEAMASNGQVWARVDSACTDAARVRWRSVRSPAQRPDLGHRPEPQSGPFDRHPVTCPAA